MNASGLLARFPKLVISELIISFDPLDLFMDPSPVCLKNTETMSISPKYDV